VSEVAGPHRKFDRDCALGALACQEERCAVSYHISSGHRFAVVVRA